MKTITLGTTVKILVGDLAGVTGKVTDLCLNGDIIVLFDNGYTTFTKRYTPSQVQQPTR